ncbi:MAG: hypothetical protein ABFS19_01220 [Thermodesulfobacteriota bacterium]
MIKKITDRNGVDVTPRLITVTTVEEAVRYRHIGGPTVQVNGVDIEPAARKTTRFGLA